MSTRLANPPSGFTEQIDELDHLLDQLLKLPIDKVRAAPATLPLAHVQLAVTEDEADDEPEQEVETLRFALVDHSAEMTKPTDPEMESDYHADVHRLPETPSTSTIPDISTVPMPGMNNSAQAPSAPAIVSIEEKNNLSISEIPWIEDEPLGNRALSGPHVEIVVGPTCDVVSAPTEAERASTSAKPARRSWLYWILWTWTWCFDQTLGHWFPWLRRSSVKFLLGLVGVVLFAVSIYLAWIGWQR